MNKEDIEEILASSLKQRDDLGKIISERNIDKVLLKNLLENYRSILDYIAIDIAKNAGITNKKIYFPYGQRENHFKKSISRNLPDLKLKFPELYEIIESRQPFKSNDSWIVDLCGLTNEAKHNNLSRVKKDNALGFSYGPIFNVKDISKVKSLEATNNYVNGVKLPDIKMKDGKFTKFSGDSNTVTFTNNEILRFHGKDIEIEEFINQVHSELITLKDEIYRKI